LKRPPFGGYASGIKVVAFTHKGGCPLKRGFGVYSNGSMS